MMPRLRTVSLLLALSAVAGCSSEEGPHVPEGCNPLLDDESRCLLPFPSSWFLAEGQDTATGLRVKFPAGTTPRNFNGVALDTERLELFDGFSPLTPILVSFPEGVDPANLPGVRVPGRAAGEDFSASLSPSSPVQVIDLSTGERVPLFAELDANTTNVARQTLIIRPQVRLRTATRHAVVLRDLRDASGEPLAPPEPFRILRDGFEAKTPALRKLKPKAEALFGELEALGLERGELVLAWEFTTASEGVIADAMVAMRDHALGEVEAGRLGYTIDREEEGDGRHQLKRVFGSLEVPAYLSGPEVDARLDVDERGYARARGTMSFPFVLHIPACAEEAEGPLPVMIFGHGIFGGAASEMSSGYHRELIDELCMVQAGMDWIGLTPEDRGYVVTEVLLDFSLFPAVSDRLRQAHVNHVVFARQLLKSIRHDEALRIGERAILGGTELYYYGLSNGGIQGTGFLALSPDVQRGVLGVGGGPWSLMMSRSANFGALNLILGTTYPDPIDQQLLIAFTQPLWDYTDPGTWARRIRREPVAGSEAKNVLVQESLADGAVPNLSTRFKAREIGLSGLGPMLEPVFGVEEQTGPLESAYTQWETNPNHRPDDRNVAAEFNPAHDVARRFVELVEQIRRFLRPGGMVENTCPDGICDCSGPSLPESSFRSCR